MDLFSRKKTTEKVNWISSGNTIRPYLFAIQIVYLLFYIKNIHFDFADELKIGDVGYKHLH